MPRYLRCVLTVDVIPFVQRSLDSLFLFAQAGGAHSRIASYPAIEKWLKRCWSLPGVPSSIDLPDACSSYYKQLFPLNPGGIIPSPVTPKALGLEI